MLGGLRKRSWQIDAGSALARSRLPLLALRSTGLAIALTGAIVRDLAIFLSVVAVGVWCVQNRPNANDNYKEIEPSRAVGEIVVAKAPSGWIASRWEAPSPSPTSSPIVVHR
jgi:hypothetical protein